MRKKLSALAALLALMGFAPRLRCASETRTILVFPFENRSARPDLDWLSEGFAEIISSRLAEPTRYVLGREERNAAYEEVGVPPGVALTLATKYKVAETLGVDWAVLGDFTVEGNRLESGPCFRRRVRSTRHDSNGLIRKTLQAAP